MNFSAWKICLVKKTKKKHEGTTVCSLMKYHRIVAFLRITKEDRFVPVLIACSLYEFPKMGRRILLPLHTGRVFVHYSVSGTK
jgi:hypothetical protein